MATRDEDGVWMEICYFVEFEKDDKGFWTRKFVGDEEGTVTAIHARKSISYDELCKKVMEEVKIDSRLYELEMRCENPVPSGFPEPPMKIDCDNRVRFLMANSDRRKLSITLKRKGFQVVEPYVVKSGASIELLEKSHDVDVDVDVDDNGRDVFGISGDSSETRRVEKSHNIAIDGNADTYGLGGKRPQSGVLLVDPSLLSSVGKDVVLNACQSSFVRKKRIGRMRRQYKNLLSVGHEVDARGDYKGEAPTATATAGGSITEQRRCCLHCGTDSTPQWRDGPMGLDTLCNACGLRYKFGRLVPEYRPACSPSNSDSKIIKMMKQKQRVVGNACGVRHEVDVRGDCTGEAPTAIVGGSITGQRRCCLHCGTDTTVMWRVGPTGPKTLCNACGLKYKSGRLDPCSPTFSARLHSNSHVRGDDIREAPTAIVGGSITGERKCCLHCGTDTTPMWRVGPVGPNTLCNACGLKYKSGRLVPEYRPACSPTFSAGSHSNSHRQIIEMRKQKQQVVGMVNDAF